MKIQMYFDLADGRDCLYQWDLNRQMIVSPPEITQLHFCNGTAEEALVCQVREGRAEVPNILLQQAGMLRVYGYAADHTELSKVYRVNPRKRPADYVYTETETLRYGTLEKRIENLEKNGLGGGPGMAGADGKSAYEIAVEHGFEGTETAWLESLVGEQGDAGPAGPQGRKGETGPVGPQGVKGDSGPTGPQGAKGDVGPTGPQGAKGDTGPTGPQGAKGDTGPAGPQGEKGETGPAGPQGEKGDTGPTGPQGAKGDSGPAGPAGADGVTPVCGVDYFTEVDKNQMVNSVLAQLPVGTEITISATDLTPGESPLANGEVYLVYE